MTESTIVDRLRREVCASEELDPTNSSIAVMREAADTIEAALERVQELHRSIQPALQAVDRLSHEAEQG